jgi:ADP-ribose pyrophosphatase YjhB (NUDIX family)
MNYCSHCAAPVGLQIPAGDDRPRYVCQRCGAIHYQNPRLVVGCIALHRAEVLLCRRAIEPRCGLWTLPAGYLENGETAAQGARRETLEEAGARVTDLKPYLLYNLAFINQIYLLFRARLVDVGFAVGQESLEVRLFREQDIPWDQMAFKVMVEGLHRFFHDRSRRRFGFTMGDIAPEPRHARMPAG